MVNMRVFITTLLYHKYKSMLYVQALATKYMCKHNITQMNNKLTPPYKPQQIL